MKREIKFRGKNKLKGWVYGYLTREDYYTGENPENWIIMSKDIDYGVIPETVGQFTGETDINDKEIYDGDILTVGNKYGRCDAKVYWCERTLQYKITVKNFPLSHYLKVHLKVIGNIHDTEQS